MRLHLIGDVHGKINQYQAIIHKIPMGERSLQLGDMGLGFAGVDLPAMLSDHKFIRGNHDAPAQCRAHPNYLSDYGYDWLTGVFHIAGACSIDRAWRIPNVSWWADEELSDGELKEAIEYFESVKPKIVVSHECPSSVTHAMFGELRGDYYGAKTNCAGSRTALALQAMFSAWQPEQWYFAHYHQDRRIKMNGTEFFCLAELSVKTIEVPDETGGLPSASANKQNVRLIQSAEALGSANDYPAKTS